MFPKVLDALLENLLDRALGADADLDAGRIAVAQGDLEKRTGIQSDDEIGRLAENFNTMIEGLREWERMKVIEFELEKVKEIEGDLLTASGRSTDVPRRLGQSAFRLAQSFY